MSRLVVAERPGHILETIDRIETYTSGKSLDDYLGERMLRDAVERCLEIVSEASRHVPPELKSRHPRIAWRGVADFGNVLRHEYPNVKDPRVWQIVTHDLPLLKTAARAMLREVEAWDQT
jgi:uncharacterized protein with HEPN domain